MWKWPAGIVLALLVLPASASGGMYFPPPPDISPTWSPDSSVVVYYRFGEGLHVVDPDGSNDRLLAGLPNSLDFAFSPDWHWIAFAVYEGPGRVALKVMRPDGTDVRVVARDLPFGFKPSFSPGGTRIAYATNEGIWTAGIDGSSRKHLTTFGTQPQWSSKGDVIAFSTLGSSNHTYIVPAGGGEPTDLTQALNLETTGVVKWSPDGSRLAFVVGHPAGPRVGVYDFRLNSVRYFDNASGARLAWSPGSDAVYASGGGMASGSLVRLDLANGTTSVVVKTGADVDVAPNGSLAYSAAGECGDRGGIYVGTRRISNDCHVFGTDGPDSLTSSPYLYQIVDGRGGDDTLVARGAAYVGDELDGGAGNDVLRGGFWPDRLDGGTGDDTISGGSNYDTITGGPGRDKLFGQGGRDTIFARDGARDLVDCGTNTGRTNKTAESDKAYVDRLDVVRHCEHVYRSR